jgi:hypothetical protein
VTLQEIANVDKTLLPHGGALYPEDAVVRIVPGPPEAIQEALQTASVLHQRDLGPRVYDGWSIPSDPPCVAFAMEGEPEGLDAQARQQAISSLEQLIDSNVLRARATDWPAPANFGSVHGDAHYIGFEQLEVVDPVKQLSQLVDDGVRSELHFGREARAGGGRYLYQSIPAVGAPGRRDSNRRWRRISGMLQSTGSTVEDRLVLDVGCSAGMMLASALSEGAAWCLGWDMPLVARRTNQILLSLGCTRFDVFGRELPQDYALSSDVPDRLRPKMDGCVLFYLAVRHHIGILDEVKHLPWDTLVYEGGETETVDTLPEALRDLSSATDFEISLAEDFRDGEGAPRPLAILRRTTEPPA